MLCMFNLCTTTTTFVILCDKDEYDKHMEIDRVI